MVWSRISIILSGALAACGPTGGSLPDLPDDIPPPPSTGVVYDTVSAAPCSFDDPFLNKYCGFGVKRNGPNSADIYITMPQGGERKITLRGDTWDTRGGVEAVRLNDGTSLTVNGNEFYQISERVVLGK